MKQPGVMMEKGITKPSILIVADDFTGAN
ncbi:four-carbon acid sugar kinase family protein, partial [Escherichia coli]|nr:four-carbon acid sugar kinase family protein [Escherichia coli]